MCKPMRPLILIMVTCGTIAIAQSSLGTTFQLAAEVQDIAFCDLLNKPDLYDGKEVRFRAKYISTYEVSTLVDSNCPNKQKRVWVEFDDASVKRSTRPNVLRKVEDQIYCCMWAGLSSIRETEMQVTAVFHKPNKQGYGHSNEYCYMVTIKSVQEIGTTKTIKVPGTDET